MDINCNGGTTYIAQPSDTTATTGIPFYDNNLGTADYWNGIDVLGGFTTAPLKNSLGGATAITVNVPSADGRYLHTPGGGGPLLADYLYLNTSTNKPTITISGLTAGWRIDLVLFGANGAGQGSTFTAAPAYTGLATNLSKTTSDTGTIWPLTEGDEYVKFTDLVADANGQVKLTWEKPDANTYGSFGGMQILIPEPSAIILGSLGFGFILGRRRKA